MAEFDQIFANDPNNPQNVAENGVISIYAPGTRTLLALKTVTGGPLPNPLQLNSRGFGPAFIADGYTLVAWEAVAPGEVFNGTFKSYPGILEETVAARTAAQAALAAVPTEVQKAVDSGDFTGPAGKDGSNVVPTAQAIAAEIQTPGTPANTALNTTYGSPVAVHRAVTRQAFLYAEFLRKLRANESVIIACKGDSTTYGHDTVSADKVAPSAGSLPDGSTHTTTRSPMPWPSILSTHLNDVYNSAITVINQGYSGDTVTRAYTRWTATAGAHITTISYGINDAHQVGGLQAFIDGYERLILREINDYGSAVVLLTAMKQQAAAGNLSYEPYRLALKALAAKYGLPLIDIEPMLAGYSSIHSDGNHLNTSGNRVLGARLAAAFVGDGPAEPRRVWTGSKLATRPTVDNIVLGSGSIIIGATSGIVDTPLENLTNGVSAGLSAAGGTVTWSFYAETPDLLAFPNLVVDANGIVDVRLDFGIDQGDAISDIMAGDTSSATDRYPGTLNIAAGASRVFEQGITSPAKSLRVVNPGWHTIQVKASTTQYAAAWLLGIGFTDALVDRIAGGAQPGPTPEPVPLVWSTQVTDSFTRADSTTTLGATTTGGLTWDCGAGVVYGITAGTAYMVTPASPGSRRSAFITAAAPTHRVSADLIFGESQGLGLIVRGTDKSNFIYANAYPALGRVILWKVAGEVETELARIDGAVGVETQFRMSVEAVGSRITVSSNNAPILTHTLSSANATAYASGTLTGMWDQAAGTTRGRHDNVVLETAS